MFLYAIQTKKLRNISDSAPVQEPVRPYGVAERWHLEIWSPYNQGGRKFYVLGAIDEFSKFMVAKMLPNKSAKNCLEFIINKICLGTNKTMNKCHKICLTQIYGSGIRKI